MYLFHLLKSDPDAIDSQTDNQKARLFVKWLRQDGSIGFQNCILIYTMLQENLSDYTDNIYSREEPPF